MLCSPVRPTAGKSRKRSVSVMSTCPIPSTLGASIYRISTYDTRRYLTSRRSVSRQRPTRLQPAAKETAADDSPRCSSVLSHTSSISQPSLWHLVVGTRQDCVQLPFGQHCTLLAEAAPEREETLHVQVCMYIDVHPRGLLSHGRTKERSVHLRQDRIIWVPDV